MVTRYISRTLSAEDLESFLAHVETCSKCRDELETYFIVHKVIEQLDEEQGSVLDFQKLLEEDMRRCRRYIRKQKIRRFFIVFALCLFIGFLLMFMAMVIMEIYSLL